MELLERVSELIRLRNKYCTAKEISIGLGVSLFSLYSLDSFSIPEVNAKEGFFLRDYDPRELYISKIRDYIIKEKRFVTAFEIANNISVSRLLLCTEADGPSHSNPKHPWYSEKVVRRDTLKNEYCNTKGLTLVRIPWKGKITPEYIRSCFPGIPLETA